MDACSFSSFISIGCCYFLCSLCHLICVLCTCVSYSMILLSLFCLKLVPNFCSLLKFPPFVLVDACIAAS